MTVCWRSSTYTRIKPEIQFGGHHHLKSKYLVPISACSSLGVHGVTSRRRRLGCLPKSPTAFALKYALVKAIVIRAIRVARSLRARYRYHLFFAEMRIRPILGCFGTVSSIVDSSVEPVADGEGPSVVPLPSSNIRSISQEKTCGSFCSSRSKEFKTS